MRTELSTYLISTAITPNKIIAAVVVVIIALAVLGFLLTRRRAG